MGIEINGHTSSVATQLLDTQKNQKADGATQQGSAASANPAATDQVSMTAQAKTLQALEKQLGNLPIVDGNKVDQIKQAIANGSFEMNPDRVAHKLLSFEQQLNPVSN